MTKIKTSGIITKKDVLKYAAEQGYDIDLFLEYLKFQKQELNKNQGEGKMAVEECALANPELDMNDLKNLDWYSKWMGFGDRYCIPMEHDFKMFCTRRDTWMYEPHHFKVLQKINSDNELYVFRDDNLQCLKITEFNNEYRINLKSRDKLDLNKFDQGNILAIALVTETDDAFCNALERFYNNLNGKAISCKVNRGVTGNVEVISGQRGFSLVADTNYLKCPPFSIDININKEDNEETFLATEILYGDLDDVKKKSENITGYLNFLRLRAK